MKLFLSLCALAVFVVANAVADDNLPQTLLTTRGKELYREDFTQPLPPSTGKPIGFATGFAGWRMGPGKWEVADGVFRGSEAVERHHPATVSYGFGFQDIIVQCDLRLEDVPLDGRRARYMQIKATDEQEYVCVLSLSEGGLGGSVQDGTRINPKNNQRFEGTPARTPLAVKLGEWHTVVLEIKGDEAVGTLDTKSVTFRGPLLAEPKHSIMFVVGGEGSYRKLRIWEALPNPDWPKHKEALPTPPPPAKP